MKAAHDLLGVSGVRARGKTALQCAVASLVLLGTTTGLLASLKDPRAAEGPEPSPGSATATAAAADDLVTDEFRRWALNALLVPLLDDRQPPHWTDVALRYFCGPGTRVEIDGQPMVPGTALPATAFSIRWHADECWPLGHDALELSGRVDLRVSHEDQGLSAIVDARRLRIATARGSGRLDAAFTAWMSVAAASPGHSP